MGREKVREGGENKKERDVTPANANVSQLFTTRGKFTHSLPPLPQMNRATKKLIHSEIH